MNTFVNHQFSYNYSHESKGSVYKGIHCSTDCNDDNKKATIINREINYKIFVQYNTEQLFKNLYISIC